MKNMKKSYPSMWCPHGIKTISRRFVSQITHVTLLRKFSTSFFCCSLFKAEIINNLLS